MWKFPYIQVRRTALQIIIKGLLIILFHINLIQFSPHNEYYDILWSICITEFHNHISQLNSCLVIIIGLLIWSRIPNAYIDVSGTEIGSYRNTRGYCRSVCEGLWTTGCGSFVYNTTGQECQLLRVLPSIITSFPFPSDFYEDSSAEYHYISCVFHDFGYPGRVYSITVANAVILDNANEVHLTETGKHCR